MRLAVYNVENLFDRARALNQETWAEGRPILERYAALSKLLAKPAYTAADKRRMVALLIQLGLERSDQAEFVILRQNRGDLLKRPRGGGIEIVADGRADWSGALELVDAPVDDEAMRMTARVLIALQADVLGVVEAENRPALAAFNRQIVGGLGGETFRHVMLIDGNDDRGIDVGLMTRAGFPIGDLRSHVDDRRPDGAPIFSRDCPRFAVTTPAGNRLTVLVNHFKSKGFGSQADSNARRRAQAARTAEIYAELVAGGTEHVAVIGDLNDTPDSDPLAPLLADTDLADVFALEGFDDGGWPGTHNLCNARDKIDYLLLSPALVARFRGGGVERRGMWPGVRPRRWDTFEELTRPIHAASDHAALWADLDL